LICTAGYRSAKTPERHWIRLCDDDFNWCDHLQRDPSQRWGTFGATDPRIASLVWWVLSDAATVVNLGADVGLRAVEQHDAWSGFSWR